MAMQDRQGGHPRARHPLRYEPLRIPRYRQFLETMLDRDFPGARGREDQLMLLGCDEAPGHSGEAVRRHDHPEPHVRVEEQPHPWNSLRTFFGSGASKSSAMNTRPRSKPSSRVDEARTGTSRATGTPALAITTSSPSATRSSRRDKCVLASWTL